MSINVNCCEGLSIQRVLCNCNWGRKKSEAKEQVVYTDRNEQIVILSTPHIELPDLVLYNDIQNTDVAIFSLDAQSDVRFTSLQGRNLFQSIDRSLATQTAAALALSNAEDCPVAPHSARTEGKRSNHNSVPLPVPEHKSHPSIATPEDVAGRSFKDVLPEYMLKFLLPICKQTLQGNFLQLTIMWAGLTQLVRTYPVLDYKRRIIAGMLTISPFVSAFNVDVNRFSVGHIVDQPMAQQALAAESVSATATGISSTGAAVLGHTNPPPKRGSKPEVMVMQ